MKTVLIALSFLMNSLFSGFAEEKPSATPSGELHAPRRTVSLFEWIKDVEEKRPLRQINHSILIICWTPDQEGEFETYQISGVDG